MEWLETMKEDPLPWLMELDLENPGVRYFAMKDLLELPADDTKVMAARNDLMTNGPVAAILEAQNPEGYWVDPGPGYNPKYRATLWQIIFLFLLGKDPATADYPMGYSTKPNRSWFKFGYPIGYVTDVLQNLEVLVAQGLGDDQRLLPAIDLILRKQDDHGRWNLEYTYNGKTWVDVEEKGKPSKWVTMRALRVLKAVTSA